MRKQASILPLTNVHKELVQRSARDTQPNHLVRPTATVEQSTVRCANKANKAFANKAVESSHMVRIPKAVEVPQVHKQPVQLNARGIESNRVDRPRARLLQSRVHFVNDHEWKGFATKAAGSLHMVRIHEGVLVAPM